MSYFSKKRFCQLTVNWPLTGRKVTVKRPLDAYGHHVSGTPATDRQLTGKSSPNLPVGVGRVMLMGGVEINVITI